MTFCEKIRNILKDNEFKINSASKLEDFVDLGRSSISAHYSKKGPCPDTEPGMAVQNAIKEKLRINKEWWDTGKGDIYQGKSSSNEPVKIMPLDLWTRLERNFNNFEKNSELFERVLEKEGKEKAALLEIIKNMTSSGVEPHKVK